MAMPDNRDDREMNKFVDVGGYANVRVNGQVGTVSVLPNKISATVTFAALTTGSVGAHTLFTVTGTVAMTIFAICGTNVAGSGTIEVGTALSTAALIAQTTGTDIDANEIWHDASPDASVELDSVLTEKIVSQNVIYTIGTDTLSGGVVTFYCSWYPISEDGNVA